MNETDKDTELWQPMVDYAIRHLTDCLNSLETRSLHNDDRIAFHSIESVAKKSKQVSDALYRVLHVHGEYQQLLELFQDQSS